MATMARTRAPAALATPEDVSLAEASVAPQRQALQKFKEDELKASTLARSSEGLALEAKEARDIAVKEAEAKQLELSAQEQRGLTEKTQREIEKNPFPTFKPSQEDAVSYSQLGSLVGTLGMMLGGGAKGSAKVAIGAMTGMMKGWQTGRKELWDREVKVFDKEVQRIKSVHDSIYKDLDMGLKQLATDREAGRAKLMSAAWKAGTGSVIATLINNGRAQDALKVVRDGYKLSSDIDKRVQDIAIAERRHREAQAAQEAQRNAMIQAARIRAAAQAAKGGGGLLKPGAEVTKNYLGQNALLADMQDIAKDLKDPKMRKLINEYQLESFASEEFGKIVAQIAIDELPSELRKFLVKVRNVRNNYYLTISGKAVTGGEALRNYGVVSQPGDNAEVMSDKTEAMVKQVERTIGQYQRLYGLPSIDTETINTFRTPGENSNFDVRSLPAQDDSVSAIPKVGEIRDGYRFKGGNPGDKSNWEQVQ